jgi:hypothetical protein
LIGEEADTVTVHDLTEQRRRSLARVDAAIAEMMNVLEHMPSAATTRHLVVAGLARLSARRNRLMLGFAGMDGHE